MKNNNMLWLRSTSTRFSQKLYQKYFLIFSRTLFQYSRSSIPNLNVFYNQIFLKTQPENYNFVLKFKNASTCISHQSTIRKREEFATKDHFTSPFFKICGPEMYVSFLRMHFKNIRTWCKHFIDLYAWIAKKTVPKNDGFVLKSEMHPHVSATVNGK